MLLTEKLVWENTEQELVVCEMPSILFMNWELLSGALTDNIVKTRQHSSANVKGSWHVSTAARSLFPELIWWRRIERKWESGVKFRCAQTSKKITFSTLFGTVLPSFLWLGHMGTSCWPRSPWKEWVCCCVNRGNDLLTLGVCVHWRLYCPILMFTV